MTATATRQSTARKPRAKKARAICLVLAMSEQGLNGVVRITEGTRIDEYFLDRLDTDFGAGFVMEKRDYQPDVGEEDHRYNVCLDGRLSTCECKGFLRHGHCRHIEGLNALKSAGKL